MTSHADIPELQDDMWPVDEIHVPLPMLLSVDQSLTCLSTGCLTDVEWDGSLWSSGFLPFPESEIDVLAKHPRTSKAQEPTGK